MNILVFARAPRRGTVRLALEPFIGADAATKVHATLLLAAVDWARRLEPDMIHVAYEPADAGAEIEALLGHGVAAFPQVGEGIAGRFHHAVGRMFEEHPGPILIVWPDLPNLRPEHGRAAVADLADGADIVLGPVFDGGFYLLGLARPLPRLFELDEHAWRGGGMNGLSMVAALQDPDHPLEVGVLRVERALHRPADARAALADPLLEPGLRRALMSR